MSGLFNLNVCRVCMQNEQSCNLWCDKSLLEKYEFTTRLRVAKEDNLPKTICSMCAARLKVSYNFIKTAHDSENNLKKFIDKISSELKEVTEGSKTKNKFLNEEHFPEDDVLSLMDEESHENILTIVDDKNVGKYDTGFGVENFSANDVQNSKEIADRCKSVADYSFSKDILLMHDNNEIVDECENSSHFAEIPTQDHECGEHYNEDAEYGSENNQTYTSINIIDSNESEIHCQSAELPIEESEQHNQYDRVTNSQDDTIQCQSSYIDESSVDATNENDATDYNINNLNEEDIQEDESNGHGDVSKKEENTVYRFYCDKCNRDFSTKTNLNRHMQSHEGNRPFSCTECKKSFTQKSTLKQHMYTHTGERPYVCEVCNRGFTQCKSLIFHMRRHTGEKPFHCEYCLITFRQKDALRIHILKHHVVIERGIDGTEIFSCIICQRKYDTKHEFKTHMKGHTSTSDIKIVDEIFQNQEETFVTEISRKSSNSGSSATSECFNGAVVNISASSAAEPSRAKKFQCRKCYKCFALKKSLVRHMRIHCVKNNDTLTECLDCDLQFSSTEVYQEHLSICPKYACSTCPELVFKTIEELKVHMFDHELDQ